MIEVNKLYCQVNMTIADLFHHDTGEDMRKCAYFSSTLYKQSMRSVVCL